MKEKYICASYCLSNMQEFLCLMYVAGVCVRKCVLYDCIFLIGFGLFNDVMSTAEFV
jgi:hypothetical protein